MIVFAGKERAFDVINGEVTVDFNTRIYRSSKVEEKELGNGEVVLNDNCGNEIIINELGNRIWNMIQEPITLNMIINNLIDEYDVSRDVCEKSVVKFLVKLHKLDFIKYEK